MAFQESSLDLASKAREKFFDLAGPNIGIVVSNAEKNRGYLSGYFGMSHDLNPSYLSAVVATRTAAALIVSAADAGPALETIGNPDLIFRYGFFCFESEPGKGPQGYDVPGFESFDAAVMAAISSMGEREGAIGVDRSNGGYVWDLVKAHRRSQVVDITDILVLARSTKLSGEIERITASTRLVEAGIKQVVSQVRPGMSELDAAALVTAEMVKGGGIPRLVSVTSGPRSALADAYPKSRRIQAGDLLRIDGGCVVDGYASDMARTLVFGEPDARQAACFHAIKAGIEEELKAVKAGTGTRELFEHTVNVVREHGIPSYRRQHVGHGLGIRGPYDFPLIGPGQDATLRAGMCLCVETPYYVLGWGGMMIEDTIVVTENGYDAITALPRDLFVIS